VAGRAAFVFGCVLDVFWLLFLSSSLSSDFAPFHPSIFHFALEIRFLFAYTKSD
jgi:hypothetical protein